MDTETTKKVAQLEQGKFYAQAIEHIKQESLTNARFKSDEKWLEAGLGKMIELAVLMKDQSKVMHFIQDVACPLFEVIPTKARTGKIIKSMLDKFAKFASTEVQSQATKFLVDWATRQNRVYLRQTLETRLVGLYLQTRTYSDALALIASLLKELKKLDDKMTLIEVFLLESMCYHALRNLPKSRASLTSARSSANSVYCPALLQAQLDMQSGILHAEEKDYKTAYSYFYETMEGYSSQNDPLATSALKYMLLCKLMMGKPDEVFSSVTGKLALKYQGPEIDCIKAVAKAYQNRSLKEFQSTLSQFQKELQEDPIAKTHLQTLYDQLLEQNLIRIIEPYSRVQIAHVADTVQLPVGNVEQKLSQMILDKSFAGILDQSHGTLHVYDEPVTDKTFETTIEAIQSMGIVVESLYEKARSL